MTLPVDADVALAMWAEFPVAAQPRPLVLVGSTVHSAEGFDSNEAKIAFVEGAVDEVEALPPGVLDALCPRRREHSGLRLQVTGIRSVTAPFGTDRGDRELPAWEVSLSHSEGTWKVLDPEVAAQAWFPTGLNPQIGAGHASTASLHEDRRTLTLSFVGTPRAYADYPSATLHESETAVLVVPEQVDLIDPATPRLAYAESREVTATLSRPLGARVLLRSGGYPVAVTPAS